MDCAYSTWRIGLATCPVLSRQTPTAPTPNSTDRKCVNILSRRKSKSKAIQAKKEVTNAPGRGVPDKRVLHLPATKDDRDDGYKFAGKEPPKSPAGATPEDRASVR